MRHTPENITTLEPHEIFVFGSNLAGKHAGGAARFAAEVFGAQQGIAEGLTGQCYALPTLDKQFGKRSDEALTMSVRRLWKCALENPDKVFLLTKVGCGIAGYSEEYMASQFRYKTCPANIIKPENW